MTEPKKTTGIKPRPKEESLAKTRAWRERIAVQRVEKAPPGTKMPDGTIFAGKLPDGKKVYAAPESAGIAMDFNAAAAFAQRANNNKMLGHDDWRLPTKEELNLLYQNQNKGALKGTFKCSVGLMEQTDGDYWSSTRVTSTIPLVYSQQLNNGSVGQIHIRCRGIVRLVR